MQILILTCTIISSILSIFAIALSLWSIVEHRAMKNSTHRLEWVPVKNPYNNNEEDMEDFNKDPIEDL